jgi:hypothetical protein
MRLGPQLHVKHLSMIRSQEVTPTGIAGIRTRTMHPGCRFIAGRYVFTKPERS